jgi:tol-pal system protein YbgF
MKKEAALLIILSSLFLSPILPDQSQKIYELIYEDIQTLKKQMLLFQEKVQNLTSELQALKTQVQDIQAWLKTWQQEQATHQQRLKDIPVQYQILSDRLEQLSSKLDRLTEEFIALKPAVSAATSSPEVKPAPPQKEETTKQAKGEPAPSKEATTAAPVPATGPSPQEVYNSAYGDYLKGNYDLAIEGFRLYREQFSDSPLADNALYWIGECYYSQKNYEAAMNAFNEVILLYPKGDRVAAAYLKKGLCYLEMGQKEEALAVFKLLVSKFPLEEEAKVAQQKIKEITEK